MVAEGLALSPGLSLTSLSSFILHPSRSYLQTFKRLVVRGVVERRETSVNTMTCPGRPDRLQSADGARKYRSLHYDNIQPPVNVLGLPYSSTAVQKH
ncbi:hypothetical protein HPB50_011374 [Hyalomma asiaticum]|uniref:Uncharacterized protein n=1 Tax=Hyalomma asiaticum TaxID=266040 RepID=A0ACB7SPE0_HYAAI|nr:hypothetical protein HPB50_011374 [Hyalomma asiaticum]